MDYEELVYLGAPELPEGYFYKTWVGPFGLQRAQVRKKTWYGSKATSNAISMWPEEKDGKYLVRDACCAAYDDAETQIRLNRGKEERYKMSGKFGPQE